MLLTTVRNETNVYVEGYLDALDYMARMKAENKVNAANASVADTLYASELELLAAQGYFNSDSN